MNSQLEGLEHCDSCDSLHIRLIDPCAIARGVRNLAEE